MRDLEELTASAERAEAEERYGDAAILWSAVSAIYAKRATRAAAGSMALAFVAVALAVVSALS